MFNDYMIVEFTLTNSSTLTHQLTHLE